MAQAYRAKAAAFGAKARRPDQGDGGETVLAGGVDAQKVTFLRRMKPYLLISGGISHSFEAPLPGGAFSAMIEPTDDTAGEPPSLTTAWLLAEDAVRSETVSPAHLPAICGFAGRFLRNCRERPI